MARMGHDSTRAASIYLHSSAKRQRAIADQVGRNAKAALKKSKRSGTRTVKEGRRRMIRLVELRGLEPLTLCLQSRCSSS